MSRRMRVWHQSLTVLEDLPAYRRALEERLTTVCEPGTEVVLHGMAPHTYRSSYPGADIRYLYFQHLHTIQILESVKRAEAEGFDAFVLCTFPDTGFEVARTLVDIPVVGLGFASMHMAAYLGSRFGIVCFIPELAPLYAANAVRYGLRELAGPVVPIGLSFEEILRGFEDPAPVVEAFDRTVRDIAGEGVDVVIPAEAVLGVLLAREGVSRVDEIPVVDTVAAAIKMAEVLVTLKRTSGMRVARRGYFFARPPSERVRELSEFYGVGKWAK